MVLAFEKFKDINKLETIQQKHREWLKDYQGLSYSIAEDGKHKRKWATSKEKYFDSLWEPSINCIGRLKNRTIIEFDGDEKEAKKYLEVVLGILKEMNIGFIRSTHKGKTDYLWIEFSRSMKDNEIKNFLHWIAPTGSIIDLNFASSRKVFPVLFATHWKHSMQREIPIEFFEGNQIDYDSLKITPIEQLKTKIEKNYNKFEYETCIKEAGKIFSKKGQAERFEEVQPLFYDKNKLWWMWNSNEFCWEIVDEVDILNMIQESTGMDVISSKSRTEILNSLKQIGRKNIPTPLKKTWIQFKDTIVDIITGEMIKSTPKYFSTNPIPYELHPEKIELTPTMDRIFEEWVGKENIKLLYEILAYSLIQDYPIHRIFCFIGNGMNGKSCFLRLLKKFIGEKNCSSTELDILLTSRFEITRLHKKLVCLMGETNFNEMSKTSILKKLTGQDTIGFEYKGKDPFEDFNYAKILIATNNLPTTSDKTIGFYRRWLIIDFNNHFSEKKAILEEIPEEEYQSLALKSLIILKDLLEKREFTNEGSVEERAKRYEEKSDPLEKFLKEFTSDHDLEGYILKWEMVKRLNEWCKENKFRVFSEESIGKKMKEKGILADRITQEWYENDNLIKKQVRCWRGISWKIK